MKRTTDDRRAFVAEAAAHMEANPTTAEERMWEIVKPLGFRRQVWIIGHTKNGGEWSYVLDFFMDKLALAIEVDGLSHRTKKGRDRRRDTRLAGEGITTLRFTNKAVLKDSAFVAAEVRKWVEDTQGQWREILGK